MDNNVVDVDTASFPTAVLARSHEVPVVVDFWAEWCGPCKVLGPTLERLATEGAGSWVLAKVDVDSNQQLSQQFGIQGIPTVIAYKDGQPVNRFTGALNEAQVRSFVESIVPTEIDEAVAAADRALDAGDLWTAEAGYRAALEEDASHEGAGTGLAALLLDRGENDAALEVLSKLAKSETVRRLEAAARLATEGGDLDALAAAAESGSDADRLAWGKALASTGQVPEALDALIGVVSERGDAADDARMVVLDLFELIGQTNPVVSEYRRKLASALF